MHWLFGGGGGYTGCLNLVYLDSQSVGSEWYINHWCPKTVQVDRTVEHKQTLQQGHPIRNGICQSVHTGQQFLMLSVYCLSIYSIMSNPEFDTNTDKNCFFYGLHCPLLCDFCHLLLRHHLILSSSVSWSPPSSSLSLSLSSSSTQCLLSNHCHVHLLSTAAIVHSYVSVDCELCA